ncbi:MAG: aminotransferase class V-fold PLP-dependent enzyme [Cyanobacteria bacterium P01_H01_bin.15]
MASFTSFSSHRSQFPALQSKTYFNFGGQGPLPLTASTAITEAYTFLQETGPFSGTANQWLTKRGEQTRHAIAQAIGAPVGTVALTDNVTVGCNIALWGITWQPGDRILIGDCEHPGVIATIREIRRRFGVAIDTLPLLPTLNGGDPVAMLKQHLRSHTRLVVVSHLLWNTGQVLPLKEMATACQAYPSAQSIQILVDGAQSVGSLPEHVDSLGCDFYAFTGHKWLCGPAGVGGLYVSSSALESLHPTFIGWRGVELSPQGDPRAWMSGAVRYEVATSPYPLYEGLQAAIAIHETVGDRQARYAQICQLSDYLWTELKRLPDVKLLKDSAPKSGLVSFQVEGRRSHKKLVEHLEQKGYCLRTLAQPDCIRACVHYFTLPSEIDSLIQVLSELLSS